MIQYIPEKLFLFWNWSILYMIIRTGFMLKVTYGTWLIEGSPRVVLFDLNSAYWKLDEWKQQLWETSRIGVPYHDKESTDAIVLGFLVSWFLAEVILIWSLTRSLKISLLFSSIFYCKVTS